MIFLIKLLLAHIIGDFLLQPKSWVAEKEKKKVRSPKIYLHFLIHGTLIVILLGIDFWAMAVCLMLIHGLIDLTKLYFQKNNNRVYWFFGDQIAHLSSIVGFWHFWFNPEIYLSFSSAFWIYCTALILITQVAGITIQLLLAVWSKKLDLSEGASLQNAGKHIGMLERLFVFVFVITGKWEAIGFLLAAKSVFRFGDLRKSKDRKLTEYILIGTLISFGISILTGLAVLWIVEKI
ncbi:Protein of unknown function [Algoriphagus alkaliphilus]|uniref:DUF3307 domain-containing protein n=1 Tax=Algoriphagus alkaliphilus TaxID=279824 RepID=A0A1G5X7N2_9BACT|nr:DUF3307 domain-containing protein [Algoriphagus alkaliphilus]MBA4298933.1 DUF3307 domain-containing protein [Cyclobacterium sp.]SDA66433.1 Protein of unknown function [Algoriphagus alkaliphilus]